LPPNAGPAGHSQPTSRPPHHCQPRHFTTPATGPITAPVSFGRPARSRSPSRPSSAAKPARSRCRAPPFLSAEPTRRRPLRTSRQQSGTSSQPCTPHAVSATLPRAVSTHVLRPRHLHLHRPLHHTSPAPPRRPSRLFNLARHACFGRIASRFIDIGWFSGMFFEAVTASPRDTPEVLGEDAGRPGSGWLDCGQVGTGPVPATLTPAEFFQRFT
jgi:hypothetical protein